MVPVVAIIAGLNHFASLNWFILFYHYFYQVFLNLHICIPIVIGTNLHIKKSGGYRSRTDDPLRARQML